MARIRAVDSTGQIVHVGVSFNDDLIVASSQAEPNSTYASANTSPGFATFPRGTAENTYSLHVAIYTPTGDVRNIVIDDVTIAFPHVQALPDGGLLLVGARSYLHDGVGERNALLIDHDGKLGTSFCIGDGIQSVQVTPSANVWVGYFDEGVFGNMGWGGHEAHPPLGAPGLVCWSLSGEQLYRFEPPTGLGSIDDCYAMCAVEETAWACYYSGFPICRATVDGSTAGWRNDVAGAHQIAVQGDRVGLIGGYSGLFDRLVVGRLGDEVVETPTTWQLALPGGDALPSDATVVARGRFVHALANDTWFRLDIGSSEHHRP